MNKPSRLEGDGYAVEVSLLKLKAPVLVLAATCFVVLAALLSWLGDGARHLASAKTDATHTASRARRVEPPLAMPNSATSQPARDENKRAAAASEASPNADAVPVPSPAGFAENAAQNAAPPAAPEVKENNPAAANAATPPGAQNVATNGAGGGYAVQTGSFPSVSEANEHVSALRAAGFEARAVSVELQKRGIWYRVYAGRFASREEAVAYDRKLRASGAASQTIVTAVQD